MENEIEIGYDMSHLLDLLNELYNDDGFDGVISWVEGKLNYGQVIKKSENMYCITTGGWSDDESLLDTLTHWCCVFGNRHYVGMLRGGAYYFSKKNNPSSYDIEIIHVSDREND